MVFTLSKYWSILQSMKRIVVPFALTVTLVVALFAISLRPPVNTAAAATPTPTPTPQTCYSVDTTELLQLTNKARTAAGVVPLALNDQLKIAAALKAGDMTENHYWSHDSPTGKTPWYWLTTAGYKYRVAAENLAEAVNGASQTNASWLQSPGHRANMLNPAYTEVGFFSRCGTTDKATTLVVAEYGSR
jgi:uncharacterized protein YkwD